MGVQVCANRAISRGYSGEVMPHVPPPDSRNELPPFDQHCIRRRPKTDTPYHTSDFTGRGMTPDTIDSTIHAWNVQFPIPRRCFVVSFDSSIPASELCAEYTTGVWCDAKKSLLGSCFHDIRQHVSASCWLPMHLRPHSSGRTKIIASVP